MRRPPLRFTLGQLIALITFMGIFFAALRMPIWPIILAMGIDLAGFAVDRGRGGSGLNGAMLTGAIGFATFNAYIAPFELTWSGSDLPGILVLILGSAVLGAAGGVVLGHYWARPITFFFRGATAPLSMRTEPMVLCGLENPIPEHPQARAPRP